MIRRQGGARRLVAIALGALLATGALAGCANATKPGASTVNPSLGACHDLEVAPELDAASDANPVVQCTTTHTVQTFATGQVAGDLGSWKNRPDALALASLQPDLCTVDQLRAFLGAGARDSLTRVAIHSYFPGESAWQSGARRASCDVSVNGAGGAPAPIAISLGGVMAKPASAAIRTCYRQAPLAGGTWSLTGSTTTCDKAHSSQDINAWLDISTPTLAQTRVTALCTPYAIEFAGHAPLQSKRLAVTGVIVKQTNGTYSLHCAIGGDTAHGLSTTALLSPTHS